MKQETHVVIAGAGALGSLIGGLLAQGGLKVTLLTRRTDHVRAVRTHGLRIVGEGGDRLVSVGAETSADAVASADVIVMLCKSAATRELSRQVASLMHNHSLAISFQNGLGNEQAMAEILGTDRVLGGLTSLGATLEAPGVVRSYATLPSAIGEMRGGQSERARALAATFSQAGVPTEASSSIRRAKWQKLMLNVAMSATSGLTGLTIGEVAALPALERVARRAMKEAAMVAEAEGISLPHAERYAIFDRILTSGAAQNKTSMRRDIEAGRPTEVAAIYISIIERAHENNIPVPTLEALAALVLGLESATHAAMKD